PRPGDRSADHRAIAGHGSNNWLGQKPRMASIKTSGDMSMSMARCGGRGARRIDGNAVAFVSPKPDQDEIGCRGMQTQREPIASVETGDDVGRARSAATSLMMSRATVLSPL